MQIVRGGKVSLMHAWVNLNSLENFRSVLTPLNYKIVSAHVHNRNMFRQSFSSAVVLCVTQYDTKSQ